MLAFETCCCFAFACACFVCVRVCPQSVLPTTGGNLTLRGSDFGNAQDVNDTTPLLTWLAATGRGVTIDDVPCDVLSWSDAEIVCNAPVGVAKVLV